MAAGPLSIEYDETGGPLALVGVTVPYTMTDVPGKKYDYNDFDDRSGRYTIEGQNSCRPCLICSV